LPSRVIALTIAGGSTFCQCSWVARSSRSRNRPLATSSSNCLPVLNCIAVGGLPPTIRLMPAVRAFSPPAIALSTQVPPASVNLSANTLTAADSPPEVHQWITSAFISCAPAWAAPSAIKTVVRQIRRMARITDLPIA
jgi:hypothetical protein